MDLAWPWAVAVAVGWWLIELVAWLRAPDRPALSDWLSVRMRRHWPLALILALPGVLGGLNATATMAGLGVVLILWLVAPDGGGDRRLTDPLFAIGRGLRGLRRSPWLVVGLIVCWLASAGINNLMYERWRVRASTEPTLGVSGSSDIMSLVRPGMLVNRGSEGAEDEPLAERMRGAFSVEVDRMLPMMRELLVGYWPYTLLGLALLVTLLWARRRRPPWIGDDLLSRSGWPANLLAAMFILAVAIGWRQFEGLELGGLPGWRDTLRVVTDLIEILLTMVVIAPMAAMEWRVVLQVASGERWDLRRALPSAIESWAPIAVLLVIAALPASIGLTVHPLAVHLRLDQRPYWVNELRMPLNLLLALAPWIIVGQRMGFRAAMAESYRLAMAAGPALLVFAARYLALFTVGFALVTLLGAAPGVPGRALGTAQMLLGDALTVLMTLAVGAYYLQLLQQAGEPLPDGAIRVRPATPEEAGDDPLG